MLRVLLLCTCAAQAQASAAVNAVVAKPELVTNWLKQVKLPNYMQLQKWVSAFPPATAAVPPPQQAPPQQQVRSICRDRGHTSAWGASACQCVVT